MTMIIGRWTIIDTVELSDMLFQDNAVIEGLQNRVKSFQELSQQQETLTEMLESQKTKLEARLVETQNQVKELEVEILLLRTPLSAVVPVKNRGGRPTKKKEV